VIRLAFDLSPVGPGWDVLPAGPGGRVPIGPCRTRRRHSPDRPPGSGVGHPVPQRSGDRRPCPACPADGSSSQYRPTSEAEPQAGGSVEEMVLGVDTHKEVHVAALISALGALLSTRQFPATATSYQALPFWAPEFGTAPRAGVEGSASYGAALKWMVRPEGVTVVEVNRPDRRSPSGKSAPTRSPPSRSASDKHPSDGRSGRPTSCGTVDARSG
jgi:hypothetical protein